MICYMSNKRFFSSIIKIPIEVLEDGSYMTHMNYAEISFENLNMLPKEQISKETILKQLSQIKSSMGINDEDEDEDEDDDLESISSNDSSSQNEDEIEKKDETNLIDILNIFIPKKGIQKKKKTKNISFKRKNNKSKSRMRYTARIYDDI